MAGQPTLTDQRCFANSRSAVIYQLIESPRVTVHFLGNGSLAIPSRVQGQESGALPQATKPTPTV